MILDIGTGTGLLSLMLAQKSDAVFHAVEIDANAAQQARENFASSPWEERLHVIEGDIKNIALHAMYDLIISNPPFFENDLKSTDTKRNLALHSEALNLQELIGVTKKCLSDTGKFAVLLPFHRQEIFIQLATAEGFYLEEKTSVKQTPAHPDFRAMLLFAREKSVSRDQCIIIRDGENYSDVFVELLKDYYLKL